eukprot:11211948-Lingulodinium_polyedra.AAC.3
MQEKIDGDDKGQQWRQKRICFCRKHAKKPPDHRARAVQAVADFRYVVVYPEAMKDRAKDHRAQNREGPGCIRETEEARFPSVRSTS